MTRHRQTVTHIPVEQLTAHPGNIRRDLGDLTEMALSIREQGIIQPLVLTEHGRHADRYIVLDGHRRLSAGVLAGVSTFPSIVRHQVDDRDQIILMLVADLHHKALDAIERAEAMAALINQGVLKADIARQAGVSASLVSKYLTLLDLDPAEQAELRAGNLPVVQAVEMVRGRRQDERTAAGRPLMGAPVKQNLRQLSWFNASHRLAGVVRRTCTHVSRPKVGAVGCGPCWEQAIRDEDPVTLTGDVAAGVADALADPVNEEFVDRILSGAWELAGETTRAEKFAITARWLKAGGTQADLGRRTGWKVDRYVVRAVSAA